MYQRLRSNCRRLVLNSRFARFFQGEGPKPGPVVLAQRRVYILPTQAGLLFAVVIFIMLLASINYSNSLGYLLTFVLAGVVIIVIIHTYRNLYHLQVNIGAIEPVFAESPLRIPLQLHNDGSYPRFALTARLGGKDAPCIDVAARNDAVINLVHRAVRRGWYPVGRFILETRFPTGLFRAWSVIELDRGYWVYPTPSATRVPPPASQYRAKQSGDQGRGVDDFIGLRNYHSGDSLRHVHWKAYARAQNLLVKQFGGDRSDEVILDWRNLPWLATEARLSQLTRSVLDAEQEQVDYGLWLPGVEIAPGRGPEQRLRCLKALALFC